MDAFLGFHYYEWAVVYCGAPTARELAASISELPRKRFGGGFRELAKIYSVVLYRTDNEWSYGATVLIVTRLIQAVIDGLDLSQFDDRDGTAKGGS